MMMMREMSVENILTMRLSNHKSDQTATRKDDKSTIIKQQLQEKTSSDRLNLTPIDKFIFLKRKFQTNDASSRGGKRRRRRKDDDIEVDHTNEESSTTTNYTTKKSIKAHEMTNTNHKYDSSKLMLLLAQQNPHPFNIVCLVARSVLANCCFTSSYCSSKVLPRRRRQQSSACSMTYLLILATLAILHTIPLIAAGQQQRQQQQQQVLKDPNFSGQTISSNSYHEAENSETILRPTKEAETTTTSGFHKQKLVEQEISKFSEHQNKNKSKNENEDENQNEHEHEIESQNQEPHQEQKTAYHDSNLDLDIPFHSLLLNEINKNSSIKWKRSKRSLNRKHGRDIKLDIAREVELELEARRKPISLSSISRQLSKRNNIWQQNRYRRQLVQDGGSTLAVTEQTFGTVLNENQTGECNRLLKFWASFKFSYPSLAAHLLTVHISEDAPPQANQFSFKTAQLIKSIARLLNEAELLARFSTTSSNNSNNNRLNPWLSRVLTNPMYAKIAQHFPGANQQLVAKLQQQRHHLMRVNNNNNNKLVANNHMTENNQQQQEEEQQSNNSDGHVYGRVIHYPHELNSNEGSPMRTLQKLRELSNQRHLSDSSDSNQGVGLESQSQDRELESNRIQTMSNNGGDGEPWTRGGDLQKLKDFSAKNYESDLDSARNKFVYGSVLLKPNQNNEAQGNELPLQRHQNSVGTLRQLQRASLDHQTSGDLLATNNARGSHHQVEPAIESYGRVLVSPAGLSRQQQEENQEHNDGDNEQQQQQQHHHHHDNNHQHRFDDTKQNSNQQQSQQDYDRWLNKPTLDKLKQKLDTSTNQFGSPSLESTLGNGNAGELGEQQQQQPEHKHVNSMAPHSNFDSGTNPTDSNNEFEGDWHSGPLQQVEIRQSNNNDASTGHVTHTTSNPRDVFIIE